MRVMLCGLSAWLLLTTVVDCAEPVDLPALVRAAKDDVRTIAAADVEQAQSRLRAAAEKLSLYLDSGGQNGALWKTYLRWSDLQSQSAAGSVPAESTLLRVHERFAADHQGLEMPVFRNVRHALRAYVQTLQDAANAEARAETEQRLDLLAASLQQYHGQPKPELLDEIGSHLGWLEEHRQVPALVQGIRARFARPNLDVQISQRFVNAGAARPIDESLPLNASVSGMSVAGSAQVVGQIIAHLLPDEKHGRIQAQFTGSMTATIQGSKGPVTVCAAANASLGAQQVLLLDAEGAASEPPAADARANLDITGVGTSLRRPLDRVARRVVCRIATKKEGEAGASASQEAERALTNRMQEEADRMLGQFNALYVEKLRNPMLRRDQFPQQFDVHSTRDTLAVRVLLASAFQLGPPIPPPADEAPSDVKLYLHESAVNNFAAGMLAGRSFSEQQLREQFAELTGQPAKPRAATDDEVTLTLAGQSPVTLRVDGGVITLTVRGQRFVVRNSSYPPMNISISYRLEKGDKGFRVKRIDEPEIVPPRFAEGAPRRYAARELAVRRILLNRLERDLQKEFDLAGVPLPEPFKSAGPLTVTDASAERGWLGLTAQLPQTESPETGALTLLDSPQ